ncbi:MAG: sigma-54-dependent Fis family transcriptional regulator [Deltaproteobacteria bacterium]|nr:sigma-54-dependent Fis family transcriptional regulator [Deltaproteobacteria bacterium]
MSAGLLPRVLVVDDERISRHTTAVQLRQAGYLAEPAENAFVALERLAKGSWDVVLTDLRMPGMDGLAFLRQIRQRHPSIDVIIMTAYGSVETAVAAMQDGAADYLTKPFRFQELDLRLRRMAQLREAQGELQRLRSILDQTASSHGILGEAPAIRAICDRLPLLADSSAPVLVSGETGTGKELVSRALHDLGPRRRAPYVALACGAIPRELAESQLFGHERGAFTGAIARRKGCFEQANGGTILLDDVDDLPQEIQAKLLRVLQEGTLSRVGGGEDIAVDVRTIATTKHDLATAVEDGGFRRDLYYRLCGLELRLPPLRDRGDDVLLLAQHFLRLLASKEGHTPKCLSTGAADVLRRHGWPGNVRELRRVMESAVTLCPMAEVQSEHLPEYLRGTDRDPARPFSLHLDGQAKLELPELVRQFEEEIMKWAMQKARGQQSRAAELLGLPRTTLQSKLGRPREGEEQ